LHIHENQVVPVGFAALDRLEAIVDNGDIILAKALQDSL
jgi:hypothetical protein